MLAGGGRIHASAGGTYLTGARVLLVDAVVVQMAAVASAAYFVERAGAEVVGAAVLGLIGSDTSLSVTVFRLLQD
jgi:adenine/guanine phosphoribosyltransferase-like PRPP-binding protein